MSRAADPLLTVFPSSVLRAILCGGEGLPAAWGPLSRYLDGVWTWNPLTQRAIRPATIEQPAVLAQPDGWTLPLEHWRARLARVAAWMLGADVTAAEVRWVGPEWWVSLNIWPARERVLDTIEWTRSGQLRRASRSGAGVDIPALNALLPMFKGEHDPAVALLLALYDVPEIRARVEAVK